MSIAQERYIERNAGNKIRTVWPNALFIKLRSTGLPDRLVVLPGGGILFIEFKTPEGQLRPTQKAIISILTRLGAPVYVCTSTAEALAACSRHAASAATGKRRNPTPKAAVGVSEAGRRENGLNPGCAE